MEKNEQQMPRLGEPVPAFEAMTTKGKISFPDDYEGKWVILFSHPADFTPICTTEILTFGARTAEFRALNCELVGLSVDSRNSHIAWLKTIREKIEYKGMKNVKVEFPIIDDVSMKVASLYGMIQPGESQTLILTWNVMDMASFNEKNSSWELAKGEYQWMVAASSADVRCTAVQRVTKARKQKVHDAMRAQVPVAVYPMVKR